MIARADFAHIATVAAFIRDLLGDDQDERAFLDTLEGETDAFDVADALIDKMQADMALAEAIKTREADLADRRKRIEGRAAACKASLGILLDAMGSAKIERPGATVSRRPGSLSVLITDEEAIPTQLRTVKTIVTPDKAAIKAQIEAGETVPGAALVRGDATVAIRVK
jgi:hypothetical protein